LHRITLHYITSHYITLHYITIHYITIQHITSQYNTLHYIASHYITLHFITLRLSCSKHFCPKAFVLVWTANKPESLPTEFFVYFSTRACFAGASDQDTRPLLRSCLVWSRMACPLSFLYTFPHAPASLEHQIRILEPHFAHVWFGREWLAHLVFCILFNILHYITSHYITLDYITLQYITLHYNTLD
jgi:hypothetical protein